MTRCHEFDENAYASNINGYQVGVAYKEALKRIDDHNADSAMVSVGCVIKAGQPEGKQKGFQVFVAIYRYDEELLKKDPDSGGLKAFKTAKKNKKKKVKQVKQ